MMRPFYILDTPNLGTFRSFQGKQMHQSTADGSM